MSISSMPSICLAACAYNRRKKSTSVLRFIPTTTHLIRQRWGFDVTYIAALRVEYFIIRQKLHTDIDGI